LDEDLAVIDESDFKGIGPVLRSKRDVARFTYRMVRKCRSLKRGRVRGRIRERSLNDQFSILTCLHHIRETIELSLGRSLQLHAERAHALDAAISHLYPPTGHSDVLM
jgi:hypothetical protein